MMSLPEDDFHNICSKTLDPNPNNKSNPKLNHNPNLQSLMEQRLEQIWDHPEDIAGAPMEHKA